MKKKLIEIVCEGNFSRSKIVEAVGSQYIKELGLSEQYKMISSGINVGMSPKERIATIPISSMQQYIDLGKQRGIYSDKEVNSIDEALRNKDRANLKSYFLKSARIFEKEEIENKEEILVSFKINKKLKTAKTQTIPRKDVIAVLSTDKEINKIVEKLYEEVDYNPIIDVLGIFATGDSDAEIIDGGISMYGSKEVYSNIVRKSKEYIPLAINKIIDSSK